MGSSCNFPVGENFSPKEKDTVKRPIDRLGVGALTQGKKETEKAGPK